MKITKRIMALSLAVLLVAAAFSGCSGNKAEKYSDETLIIGYTDASLPFLEVAEDGSATGFEADLFKKIFEDVKGDLKSYVFEKVEEGYELEDEGGFLDSEGKEYSAGLLMGAVSKNNGTFNEDYSFTEPIISDRVIALTTKNNQRNGFADFAGASVITVGKTADKILAENGAIASVCREIKNVDDIKMALNSLDRGDADIVVTDEFAFNPLGVDDKYKIFSGELDTIEYVIACAKYSGWKDSLNEAIRELKSEQYGKNGDEFTPLVEKYFGYNASSFDYKTEGDD